MMEEKTKQADLAFLRDIVALCEKHNVLISSSSGIGVTFENISNETKYPIGIWAISKNGIQFINEPESLPDWLNEFIGGGK